MSLSFIWYWNRASEIYPLWRDGLRGALEELSKTHTVDIYLGEVEPPDNADFLLFWGDSDCPFFEKLDKYKAKKGIILTTNPHNIENLKKLDVVFCESVPVYEEVRRHGLHAVLAFGTDTDFYTPDWLAEKTLDYFYPATFSPWKKQSSIVYLGDKLLCVGTLQQDGEEELRACRGKGVRLQIGYFPPEAIRDCYNHARFVPIPAIHGSERTCLEAMSMNIVPTVNPENKRTLSYIEEYIHSGSLTPRDFVVSNYGAKKYAEKILKAI